MTTTPLSMTDPRTIAVQSLPMLIVRSGISLGLVVVAAIIGTTLLPDPPHPNTNAEFSTIGFQRDSGHTDPDPADPDPAMRECVVTLISGRTITGEFIRQDTQSVVIGLNNIETTFQRDSVDSIIILAPVDQRYRTMRSAIPDDDLEARLVLVEWLRARRAYTLALDELDSVLIRYPSDPRAKLLHSWLSEFTKLTPVEPKNRTESDPQSPKKRPKLRRNVLPTLTAEQINLMRVYEIDLRNPPKLKVPDDTLRALMQRKPQSFSLNAKERDAIFKLPEIEKLKILFTNKARDLYHEVLVLEDPASISMFKTRVHSQRGWILNACATTRCHGGPDAGSFKLINTHPNSDQTAYTNFYIIEHSTLADGSPLINFDDPQRSALLQMGMAGTNTLTPHPEIPRDYPGPGFRPIFRTTRDRKFRDAVEWINSLYQPRPEYGIEYPTQPEPKSTQTELIPDQPAP